MTQELYAFWSYDTFPYLRGGIVTEIETNGKVRLGDGWSHMTVKPRLILPAAEGRVLLEKLEFLDNQFIQATRDLLDEFKGRRNSLLKPYEGFWHEDWE